MPSGIINLALGLAIQVGTPGPSETPNAPPLARAYGQYGFEGSSEQRYPFDSQMNWVHGYHQEISAYPGHSVFRPYNYKDVLSQSQTAAGWGERPGMPYSQQFWHKYQDQAAMLKAARSSSVPSPYVFTQHSVPQSSPAVIPSGWMAQPNGLHLPSQQIVPPPFRGPAGPNSGSIAIPVSMPDSLQPPALQPPALQPGGEVNQINYRR
jgi:hypothetical protein